MILQLSFQSAIHSDFISYIAFSLVANIYLHMKFDTSPFRNWFGYTRGERRGSFILLIIIIFIISVRILFPEKNLSIEYISLDFKDDLTGSVTYDTLTTQGTGEIPKNRIAGSQPGRKKKAPVVDINRCDTSELIKLPGIGPVLSVRIIKYRKLLGGFARTDQLREVYGLPEKTYELIKDQIHVDTLMISAININSADFKTLVRFPYFEKYEVTSILKYRELEGRIKDIQELVDNKIIAGEKALKVRPYLRFDP